MLLKTIPGGVILINPALDPTATTNLKPADIYLSVDWSGNMVLTGYFRVSVPFSFRRKHPLYTKSI